MVTRFSDTERAFAKTPFTEPQDPTAQPQQGVDPQQDQQTGGFVNQVKDLGQGIAYGATESVRSAYNLFDFATGDNIFKDWDQPLVSKPTTIAGNVVGSLAQFAVPYAGLSLALKGATALQAARAVNLGTKSGKILSWLSGSQAGAVAKGAIDAHNAGQTVLGASRIAVFGSAVARSTIKGGVVDFLAFENTGERLADTIQAYPQLSNPLSEYLAADEDEGELEGRFKNALEGAGLGVLFDGVFHFARGLRAGRKVEAAGGSAEDVRLAQIAAVDESRAAAKVQKQLIDDAEAASAAAEVTKRRDAEGSLQDTTVGEVAEESEKALKDLVSDSEELNRILGAQGITQADEIRVQDAVEELNLSHGKEVGIGDNPRKLGKLESDKKGLKKTFTNFSQFTGTRDGGKNLVRALERLKFIDTPSTTTVKQHEALALREAAKLSGVSHREALDTFLAASAGDAHAVRSAARRASVARLISHQIGETLAPRLEALGKGVGDVTIDDAKEVAFHFKSFLELQQSVKSTLSELGRGLNLGSQPLEGAQDKLAKDFEYKPLDVLLFADTENFDADKAKRLMVQLHEIMRSPDPVGNLKAAQELLDAPWHQKALSVGLEYHINALLSGLGTQAVNLVSAVGLTVTRPLGRMFGAGLDITQSALTGDTVTLKQAKRIWSEEWGTATNLLSEFQAAYKIMRQSGGAFQSQSALEGHMSAIKTLGNATRYDSLFTNVSAGLNLPTKLLQKGDSFIKTWNGLARSKALIRRELIEKGTDPADIEPLMAERLSEVLKSKGRLRHELAIRQGLTEAGNENIAQELLLPRAKELMNYDDAGVQHLVDVEEASMLAGKEATFTTDVAPGIFGAAAQAVHTFTERVPALKFLIPFVNTPINIADAAWDKTLGGAIGALGTAGNALGRRFGLPTRNTDTSISRIQKRLAHSDPRVRQQAKADMAWGLGTISAIAALTSADSDDPRLPTLTGSGPTSPEVRKTLEAAGWQPFSIKVGDKYVSYSRLDPFASIIGIVADASEYLREHNDDEGSLDFQAVMGGLAASVANNITSKTYAQGLTNTMDLINEPDLNAERVLGGVAGSFVPTLLANTEKALDPDLQEIRSWTDRMQSRVPGLSASLSPRRDLLGDVISKPNAGLEFFLPIRITKVKDSVVETELSRYAYGFSQPGTTKGGVDLLDDSFRVGKQEAYDRYLELTGTHKLRGKTLRQSLRVLVKSPEYLKLSPEEGPNGEKSPRINLINSVLRKHRAAAWTQLLREIPSLRSAAKQAERDRSNRRAGRRGSGGLTL